MTIRKSGSRGGPTGSAGRGRDERASRRERARLLASVSKRRDPHVARRIAELYGERLYGLAVRILGDRQAAEDVVQDVFLCLLEGKASYRGRGHPDAFLLKVTSFLALDRARAGLVRQKKELTAMERSRAASPSAPVLEGAVRKELEEEVGRLLSALPPETRAAVTLRFWEGATVREIARILSSTKSTVARRIESALERLRRPLVKKGFGTGVVMSVLGDVLRGMDVPPPSAGFESAVIETLISGGTGASVAALPTVPPAASALPTAKTLAAAAAASVAVLAVYSLIVSLSPGDVPTGRPPLDGRPEVADAGREPGGLSADTGPGAATRIDPAVAVTVGNGRAAIAGSILGPDGRPVAGRGAVVRVLRGEDDFAAEYAWVRAVIDGPLARAAAPRGSFAFRELAEGSYRVVAMARGAAPGTSGLLRLRGGESLSDITIRLSEGGVCEGLARLESGEPAAGVRVSAFLPVLMEKLRVGYWNHVVTSGGDGTFVIPGLGSAAAETLVESDRFAVIEAPKYARSGERFDVVVAAGAAISGTVVGPNGGSGAAAEVLAFSPEGAAGGDPWQSGRWLLRRRTTAGADGSFSLSGLPYDEHVILARAPAAALSKPVTVEFSREKPSLDGVRIALRPGGTIEGRFVSGGQAFGPAKGIAVPIVTGRPAPYATFVTTRFALEPTAARVDTVSFDVAADGRFTARGLAPEEYVLFAYQDTRELFEWSSPLEAHTDGSPPSPRTYRPGQRNVEIEVPALSAEILIAGQVTDASSHGLANVSVECSFVRLDESGRSTGGSSGSTVWTDQRGVFRLVPMMPLESGRSVARRLDLIARTPDGRVGRLEGISIEDRDRLGTLRVVIDAGPAIAGRVWSAAGDPIAGATIRLEQDGHEPWPRAEPRETTSDENGDYRFGAVEDDRRYNVTVEADGWARATLSAESGRFDADFALAAESVIRGRVVDLDGEPVGISSVSLSRYDAGGVQSFPWDVESDADGRFVLRGLEAGEYSLSASGKAGAGGRNPQTRRSERFTVAEGETLDGVVLTMTDLVAIEGQAIDARTGAPVSGATIADWDPEARRFPRGRLRVMTGRDGRFRLEGFPRGSVRLHAVADGYLHLEEDVLVSGEADTTVVLKLTPTRTIEVVVTGSDGRPVEGARVFSGFEWPKHRLTDQEGRARVFLPALDLETPADKRKAWIEVHKAGYKEERIELEQDESAENDDSNTSKVRLTGDVLAVRLVQAGRVTGEVLDHLGAPVTGAVVTAYRERHGRGTTTGEEGLYTISGLEPGEYEVRLTSETRPMPVLTRGATVSAGRETRVDFSIPDPATFDVHAVHIVATYDDGRPASGAGIRVSEGWTGAGRDRRAVTPFACFANQHELRTGRDGTLEILFQEGGVQGIYVYGSDEKDGELYRVSESRCPVVDGEAAVVFTRIPRGDVTLRVRDAATGEAVPEYEYSFGTKGHGSSGSRCRELDGVVRRKVRAGDITVTVNAEGFAPFERAVVVEDHGEVTVDALLLR